jgi:serine/threonine protein kinase
LVQPGTRLGPYEILAPIGAGGMGEVFRARDTRLDRSVAIKVLPDGQLKSRFEREAKAISQLSHPHICALYDVGHDSGVDYLVMELLDGVTLADRISMGPMPLADVVRFGTEIAEALETAHRKGIVHRDVKPHNIMITKSGAKLLDFGLAKPAIVDVGADGPTMNQITREGAIVGTFQYMSPEQLSGLPLDARSDVFALGAVLYEMITGRRAFATIASGEPPPLPDHEFEPLIAACLQKDPDARMQSAHDVAIALNWKRTDGRGGGQPPSAVLPWSIAALLAIVVIALLLLRPKPAVTQPLRFHINPPPATAINGVPAISPDGSRVAFPAITANGSSMLWLRSLDSIDAQPLKGTEGVTYAFWSPDGKNIGFIARGKLQRIDPADGSVRLIYEPVEDPPGGATWNANDVVVFAPGTEKSLYRVAASGGTATPLPGTTSEVAYWPHFLPDGDHFLYLREYAKELNGVYVGSLSSSQTKLVVPRSRDFDTSRVEYANGNLYVARGPAFYRMPFDVKALEVRGETVKIDDDVQFYAPGRASFSVSTHGTIVYRKRGAPRVAQVKIVDRSGQDAGTIGGLVPYGPFALSPDATHLAYTRDEEIETVWVLDRARGTSTRLALEDWAMNPIWLPDGRSLLYSAAPSGPPNVFLRRAGSNSEMLRKSNLQNWATSVTPDGKLAIYDDNEAKTKWDIYAIPLDAPHTPRPLLTTEARERDGKISPDGKWLAFVSDESGAQEIYAVSFPALASRVQLSSGGGVSPRWSHDGGEMFYLDPASHRLMAVRVSSVGGELRAESPVVLFPVPSSLYDVTPDGKFLITQDQVNADAPPLTVIRR